MSRALVRRERGDIARLDTIDAQLALFRKHRLAESMAERYKFVEGDAPGKYKLVKRTTPITLYADDVTGAMRSITQVQKTAAERVKLSATKGKYNDEHRLVLSDVPTVEVGEIKSWSVI